MKKALQIMVTLLATGLMTSCYQYVNIPADTGDVAMHSVNADHVVNAEYEALRAVVADMQIKGPYLVVLPFNTYASTYDHMCERLGGGATWSKSETQPEVPTLEVKHVYIRGFSGTVDIARPSDVNDLAGAKQLVTVYLDLYAVGGWSAKRLEIWRMSIERALIESKNAPPGSTPR